MLSVAGVVDDDVGVVVVVGVVARSIDAFGGIGDGKGNGGNDGKDATDEEAFANR